MTWELVLRAWSHFEMMTREKWLMEVCDQNYLLKTKTLWPLSTALHIVCFSFLASWHNVHKVLPAQCRCTHSATSGVHCTKVLLNLQLLILPPTSSPPLQSVSTLTFFPLSRFQFSTFVNCLHKATNLRIIGYVSSYGIRWEILKK